MSSPCVHRHVQVPGGVGLGSYLGAPGVCVRRCPGAGLGLTQHITYVNGVPLSQLRLPSPDAGPGPVSVPASTPPSSRSSCSEHELDWWTSWVTQGSPLPHALRILRSQISQSGVCLLAMRHALEKRPLRVDPLRVYTRAFRIIDAL